MLEAFFHDYMPHGMCWDWDPVLILMMTFGDLGTGLAYMAFTFLALKSYYARPSHEQPEGVITKWVIGFIFACGIGHFLKTINTWQNMYFLEAFWGNVTAVISWICVVLVIQAKAEIARKYTLSENLKNARTENIALRMENEVLKQKIDLLS